MKFKTIIIGVLVGCLAAGESMGQNPIIRDFFTADPAPIVFFDRRSICVDYMHYNADGTIQKIVQTTQGVAAVKK